MPPSSRDQKSGEITRRAWLRRGGAAAAASVLPHLLASRTAQAREQKSSPAQAAIVIYLQGGISHYESFDPKPEAPAEYRGEFGSIGTSMPGTRITEHLPLLAKRAHQYNILRSVYVDSPSHPVAIHQTLTGWDLPGADVAGKNRNVTNPAQGAVVAKLRGANRPGIPPYVAIPHAGQLGIRVHYGTAGLLGPDFEPIAAGLPPGSATEPYHIPPDLALHSGMNTARLQERMELLQALQRSQPTGVPEGLSKFHAQACDMLYSNAAGAAFDINRESVAARDRYGNHIWGQQTILARRLVEAGVPFTLVNYSLDQLRGQDWDTHVDNFNLMKNTLLPPFDRAVSALLDDLDERGLLETTLVAIYGEFGRTPQINANAGRDHWSNVGSVVLAGGGLKRGTVLGSSSRTGAEPYDRPIAFNDVLATIYRQLGVSADHMFMDQFGRPMPVLAQGQVIGELI